jgi:TolB protein
MNADGTGLRQVGQAGARRYNPAWSPDGARLVFVQDNGGSGSGDIYTITTSGGSLTRLTNSPTWDGAPDWSADDTRIAYVCRSGGRDQVCQMTPAGDDKQVTTATVPLPAGVIAPSWSPDSASIAFSVRGGRSGGYHRIYRMTRSGGSLRELTPPYEYGPGVRSPGRPTEPGLCTTSATAATATW